MIKAFRDLGHQVIVIGPIGEKEPQQCSNNRSVLSKIKALLPGFIFEICEIGYSLYSFIQLSWIILKEKPDFVYDRYITFNIGCVLAAKLQKKPLFLEVNAPLALERSEQPDEKLYLRKVAFYLEKWACSNSWKTIVVSTPLKSYLLSIGVPSKLIVAMPNGVNPEKFHPHDKDITLMRKLGINKDNIVVGFTGVLRAWHGLEMLLESFSKLTNSHGNLFLLIVGDGPIRDELDRMIIDWNLSDSVTITGRVPYEDVHKYVNLFDIAVSPKATFYASPMKVIEYMALGKAVVVPNCANFTDLVDVDINAKTFIPDSVDSFRTCLNGLLNDYDIIKSFGVNGRIKVLGTLNWSNNARKIIDLTCVYNK